MKKNILNLSLAVVIAFSFASCATICGGKVSQCQKTKPVAGTPSRMLRPVPFVANLLFFPLGVAVDLATGAAYKPCPTK